MHSDYSGVPISLMSNTINIMGNLVTATIPVNLHKLTVNQELNDGTRVFIAGAGSGLSISQAGLIWGETA